MIGSIVRITLGRRLGIVVKEQLNGDPAAIRDGDRIIVWVKWLDNGRLSWCRMSGLTVVSQRGNSEMEKTA